MVLLTFRKKWKKKLLDGLKCRTTRKSFERWRDAQNRKQSLHIWCPSPRTGMGVRLATLLPSSWSLSTRFGHQFDDHYAVTDGFDSVAELKEALAKMHKMTLEQVDAHTWTSIFWQPDAIKHGQAVEETDARHVEVIVDIEAEKVWVSGRLLPAGPERNNILGAVYRAVTGTKAITSGEFGEGPESVTGG